MIIKLCDTGVPLVRKQSDLTEHQRVFLELGVVDHINEEREFWMKLMGAEVKGKRGKDINVRQRALNELKHPD